MHIVGYANRLWLFHCDTCESFITIKFNTPSPQPLAFGALEHEGWAVKCHDDRCRVYCPKCWRSGRTKGDDHAEGTVDRL